ncbi:hypothetical protein KO02_15100 [Sphingobacterium sp. ML3W]|uniref:LytR/AlgR family response regulator transcription factor n=1 Tax=Sphingobacterium sp. ML3W TaxID=1538644 RepID=UPI0004F6492F|nr:LytTR family DNA-binding domain-containing protein [Sphingobacterium sp. ML3W]AIM37865.1 hypothetical protein KO02_15100 [Sphingobacterium sp. ML3W]
MARIFIVEDEVGIREELIFLVGARSEDHIVGTCGSIKEAMLLIPLAAPDILLMDIELSDGQSFEILKDLPETPFQVIFITAYEHYALRAIKAGTLDYLLKPIKEKELYDALDKANGQPTILHAEQKEILFNKQSTMLVLKTLNETYFVRHSDILYCKGDGGYTTFFLQDGREITTSTTLKEYEMLLPETMFLRVHKSYLIRLNQIVSYHHDGLVILQSGIRIPVSMRKKDLLMQKMIYRNDQ